MNFAEFYREVKRPLRFGVLAGIFVATGSLFVPNWYQSEGRILPAEARTPGGLGNVAAAAAALGIGVPGGDGGDANFADILNSQMLREQLLMSEYVFHTQRWRYGAPVEQRCTLYAFLRKKNIDRALLALGKRFSASRDMKSKVTTIVMKSESPELSQQVVKRAIFLLEGFVQRKGRTRGGAKAIFAENRLQEAIKERSVIESSLRSFLNGNRNYLISPDPNIRLKGMRLEADYKLQEQIVVGLALGREQALMEEKNDVPILNVMDPGNLPVEKKWPPRSLWAILAAMVTTAGAWAWLNRAFVRKVYFERGSSGMERHSQRSGDMA